MNTITRLENLTGKEIKALIFDLDGLLVASEEYWDRAREKVVKRYGGSWTERDQKRMMGLNSKEWSAYILGLLHVKKSQKEIIEEVKREVKNLYSIKGIPAIPEAAKLLRILSRKRVLPHKKCYAVAIASSSPKDIIEFVLEKLKIADYVSFTVSSDEVRRGKPYPDVYLKAAELLKESPENILVFEDSPNGILAAKAADMVVVAVPNKRYGFSKSKFAKANLVLPTIMDFKI